MHNFILKSNLMNIAFLEVESICSEYLDVLQQITFLALLAHAQQRYKDSIGGEGLVRF